MLCGPSLRCWRAMADDDTMPGLERWEDVLVYAVLGLRNYDKLLGVHLGTLFKNH